MDRILAIDDDVGLTELLTEYLEPEGFILEAVHDGKSGIERSLSGGYTLIILDIMLPSLSGLEVLGQIRRSSRVPVIMLTARDSITDRVLGLEFGADDYLPKPFEPVELLARLRAILRRVRPPSAPGFLAVGDLRLDSGNRQAFQGEIQIDLTSSEFDLLYTLVASAGQVVSRETLSRQALGRDFSPLSRSVDNLVASLRKKLITAPIGNDQIKTIHGVGYLYGQTSNDS
ncbi:MAG TPA: response regulator transcription factor [Chthoniobacterales bacterium]|nr:response regulator transcription factor [Chthoniobacterales bacterium]